jgi:tRNA nucleotidyltransferase (CCA-adding enzyme)
LIKLPNILLSIAKHLKEHNSKALLVGGGVRDYFLHLPIKDYDIEVYGFDSLDELMQILSTFGKVNLVGKSFGVLKFNYEGVEYDFSFPRLEQKIAKGHRGFSIQTDGHLDYKTAFKRRDFTINAIGYDILSGEFIDPYGGKDDIADKTLRHIDDATFIEDPLRVYRGVQFCARFGFKLHNKTKELCQKMVDDGMLDELPKERILVEWQKLLLKSPKPSIGFELMHELGILRKYFSELHNIIGVVQSPKYHPEGDVWIHTMMSLDSMANILKSSQKDDKDKLRLMFAILCHDLGKATHTTIEADGTIRSIGHEKAGVELTKNLLYKLTNEHSFIESILPLVEHHLKPSQFYATKSKASAIRRLSTKVNIDELIIVAKADFLGRDTPEAKEGIYEAGEWLRSRADELNISKTPPKPLIQGKDLINLGLEPSPKFKTILQTTYQAQLDGTIVSKDEAIEFVLLFFNI